MNTEIFDKAVALLEDARAEMIYCISNEMAEKKEIDLDHLPLTYVGDGEVHNLRALGMFFDKDGAIKIGCEWDDEEGDIETANEDLMCLTANELFDIMCYIR